jgi:hypothetical protein
MNAKLRVLTVTLAMTLGAACASGASVSDGESDSVGTGRWVQQSACPAANGGEIGLARERCLARNQEDRQRTLEAWERQEDRAVRRQRH